MKRLALILILILPLGAGAATLTLNGQVFNCAEIQVGTLGNVVATSCSMPPTTPKTSTPGIATPVDQTPVSARCVNPAGQTISASAGIVMQTLYMGGTNNYAVDDAHFVNPPPGTDASTILSRVTTQSPSGSIQVFTVPKTWSDGVTPAPSVHVGFVDWLLNGIGVQYEIALSTCKGDFTYYKTPTATNTDFGVPIQPCGVVSGPTVSLNWTPQGSFIACKTDVAPNATWYLNWRIVPGTAGGCQNIGPGLAYHTCGIAFGTNAF